MTNNNEFRQDIYKLANKSTILSFKDLTDSTWDNSSYNNVQILITRFGNDNKAYMQIPAFVDAEELRALFRSILNGNFTKIEFNSGKGSYVSYGGSKNGGLAKENGQIAIEDGMESRICRITFNKGSFYIKNEVYKARSADNGAIKPVGDSLLESYFKLSQQQMLTTASAVVSYLNAKQVISTSNYIKKLQKQK